MQFKIPNDATQNALSLLNHLLLK